MPRAERGSLTGGRRRTAAAAAVLGLVVAVPLPAASSAGTAPTRSAPPALTDALTDAQVAALDPVAQAGILAPLRAAATALDRSGRRDASAVYAGVELDAPAGRVRLFLTDPTASAGLVAAAQRTDPGLAPAQVDVQPAAYPLSVLDAAARQVVDAPQPYPVYAVYPAPDASGVVVETHDPRAAGRIDAAGTTVPVTFVTGTPRVAHDWDATKWHDTAPFIGGDVLTRDGQHYCTAGLPAVRAKDHHPVMVTANHCFAAGQKVFTAAGTTWHYGNGRTGDVVGTVTKRSTHWDAEVLDGAANAADESDTTGPKPLTSVAYSYRGDYVCHAGARSASKGHPTPCGIKVTIADLYFREGGHDVRGVEGVDVHGWGSVNGDSGGTVFAVEPHGVRQLRGLVSSGGADGTRDQRRVDWPEAVDVFRTFGLELNPTR